MSEVNEKYDEIIVYELVKDCDSVDESRFQILHEREEEEEELFVDTVVKESDTDGSNVYVETLDDAEILQESDNEIYEDDADDHVIIKNENKKGNVNDNANVSNHVFQINDENKPGISSTHGIKRYLLFDDLVATVVEYDEENTPIVKFSMTECEQDERLPVECGICPDVMRKSKLPAHLKTHLVPGTNRYKCIYCDETYKDYKYLASHARRHMGIRPYVCEICKLYFSTKQDMRVHNQRRHLEKEHICEICGKTFSQNTMLKRHRESTHEKKRRYHCEHCPKAYYKNFSLQEHVRSVHMGQRRMLKCPFCGMQCLDAHKMARHRKLWHLNQNQFECDICQEKFTNVHYFDAHKRSIQCRNNTRRKMEEEQQLKHTTTETATNSKDEDEGTTMEEFQLLEPSDQELKWSVSEQVVCEEADNVYVSDEYVELVVEGDDMYQSANDMIFEIVDDDEPK